MRTLRQLCRAQAGNSLTEFAIVAPILVMLVFYATFFTDAFKTKLKNQEAAIFAVWEFTSFPLSDYNSSNHAALFNQAKSRIMADVQLKYAGFDSSNPPAAAAPLSTFIAVHTFKPVSTELCGQDVCNEQVPIVSAVGPKTIPGLGGALSSLGSVANKGVEEVVGLWKFDQNGLITLSTHSTYQNVILPTAFMQDRFHSPIVDKLGNFQLDDTVSLVVDPWTLNDGRDVDLLPASDKSLIGVIPGTDVAHPMTEQVKRMAFLGAGQFLGPFASKLAAVAGWLDLGDPAVVPVAALNYRHGDITTSSEAGSCPATKTEIAHGKLSLRDNGRNIDHGIFCYETLPIRVTKAYDDSKAFQVFKSNGPYYMGCASPEALDPTNCR